MAQYIFGAGTIWATPLSDAFGNDIANPTPVQLAVSQEIGIEYSFDTKKLYGQNQFPVDAGRGKGSVTVKAKFAQVNGATISSLFFGQAMTAAQSSYLFDVTGTLIPAAPATITAAAPSGGTWAADMGVRDANGRPMTRVASAPTTGQYSLGVSGVYTFAATDSGKQVFISFQYSMTSVQAPSGTRLQVLNLPMGAAPRVRLDIHFSKNGKNMGLWLPSAIANKLSMPSKQDDYMVPELNFDGFADAAGNVLYQSYSE